MRVAGIIAEYNPMHNGHIYHLERSRAMSKADFVVVVMSGDFTHRGRPAVMDKWTRAEIAVKSGADLVLELPFVFATASAELFASGGVGILEGLGVVDAICFGSECGDVEELQFLASFLKHESPEFKAYLQKHLDMGLSFPMARQLAVNECLGMETGKILKKPNNILALEYLKNVVTMTPVAVERSSDHHAEDVGSESGDVSGKAVRKLLSDGSMHRSEERMLISERCMEAVKDLVPEACYEALTREGALLGEEGEQTLFDILRAKILTTDAEELAGIYGMSEGLENRMKKELRYHGRHDAFSLALKSKRYTLSAIDRLLLHTAAGLESFDENELYARVLAFSEGGAKILKAAREESRIPVITNINRYGDLPANIKYDVRAADLYNLIMKRDLYENGDHVMRPYSEK